jgi:peptidyl-prolyl cis-trans isomerase C
MTPRWCLPILLCLLIGGVRLCACSRTATTTFSGASNAPKQRVVARGNGVPIVDSEVAFQSRDGKGPRESLLALIQLELLAQEAQRRGLDKDPKVLETHRKSMVESFIRREFGEKFTKNDIPKDQLEKAYEVNRLRFDHPDLAEVAHILVLVDRKAQKDVLHRARRLAQKIRQLAVAAPISPDEFSALATKIGQLAGDLHPDEFKRKAESLTTPLRGFTVDEFADAAFALKRPGQISPVVQTQFGYHIIYLKSLIPAIHRSLADATEEIRENLFEEARGIAFERWLESLMKEHRITMNYDRLAKQE